MNIKLYHKFYKNFNFILIYFLYIYKNILLNYRSICNIYIIFILIVYLINIILKLTFYDFYKKIKIFKIWILNIIFYLILIYLLNVNNNLILLIKNIELKLTNENLNLFSLILSLIWIIFTILIFIYNTLIFDLFLKDIDEIDLEYKLVIHKFFSFIIFFILLLIGFWLFNLDKFILSIIGGALILSLSLSLQKIFNNYISGLLILFDKSFKLGDAVAINGFQGAITQINSRYIMLRNLDCSEVLVPNEKFLTEIVQNQSLFFSKGNLRVLIQISYNNDVNLLLRDLILSTESVERVLDNPPPLSYLSNFGIDNIDLELSFWIIDAIRGAALVRSEVNINVWRMLIRNNVELSYSKKIVKLIN